MATTEGRARDQAGGTAPTDRASRHPSSAGVQATLGILDLLASSGPLALSELARELGIAKSTLHRVCAVLLERGWIVRDVEGRFALGVRALRLGSGSAELPIVAAFRTVAAEFLTRHDETIALAVLDGSESLFIALEETSQPVRPSRTSARRRTRSPLRAVGSCSPRSHPPPWRRCSAGSCSSPRRVDG